MLFPIGCRQDGGSAVKLHQFTILQHSRLQALSRVCLQLPSTALESSGGNIHFIISPQTGESTSALVLLNYSPLTKAAVKEHYHYRSQTSFFLVVVTNSHLRLLMNINSHYPKIPPNVRSIMNSS